MSSNPPLHGLCNIIPPYMMSHKYSFTPNTQNCSNACSHSYAASIPSQIANRNVMDTKGIKPFLDSSIFPGFDLSIPHILASDNSISTDSSTSIPLSPKQEKK